MTIADPIISPSRQAPQKPVVPLMENGDHLNRLEFEQRWEAMPQLKKAELIEGTVYMAAALSHDFHSLPHFDLIGLLFTYRIATPGVVGGDNGSVRLDFRNMPQPDIYLMILAAHGGQAKIDTDHYVSGAPEFVVEIANSSASNDLHQKLEVYLRNGVREYLVWRTMECEFDYMVLKDGQFQKTPIGADGIIRSAVLPGLWLNTAAALQGDWAVALQTMQIGIASAEHSAFVERLKQTAASTQA
jgi:Uma2 family endonuclease